VEFCKVLRFQSNQIPDPPVIRKMLSKILKWQIQQGSMSLHEQEALILQYYKHFVHWFLWKRNGRVLAKPMETLLLNMGQRTNALPG
jgi:hypothetical protein